MAKYPLARYDEEADVLYVRLAGGKTASTRELDDYRMLELDSDGRVLALEFVDAGHLGVDLTHIAERDTIVRLIESSRLPLKVYA